MPRSFYDDNYGEWDIRDEDDIEFYRTVQAQSVRKRCRGCKRMVKIKPDYAYCNSCATRIENGYDVEY